MIELAFFLAMAATLAGVSAGSARAYRRGRGAARRQFQALAREHNLTFSERGALDVWVAHGTWKQSELHLIVELTPLYTLRCIKIRLQHKLDTPLKFTLSHMEGTLATGSRHELGDPDFDRAFLNDGDLTHARVMLNAKCRAALLHLVDPDFDEKWREVSFKEDTWTLIKGYDSDHAAELPDGLDILRDSLATLEYINQRMQTWPIDIAQGLYQLLIIEKSPGVRALAARDLFIHHPYSSWTRRARQERAELGPDVEIAHVIFEPGDHSDAFVLLFSYVHHGDGRWHERARELLLEWFAWETFRHVDTSEQLRRDALGPAMLGRSDKEIDQALYALMVPRTQPALIEGDLRARLLEAACEKSARRGRRTLHALALNGDIDLATRAACARVLARTPGREDLEALVALLDHPDQGVVLWVIGGLELLGEGGAVPGLRQVMTRRGAVSDRAGRAVVAILEGLDMSRRGGLTLEDATESTGALSLSHPGVGGLMVVETSEKDEPIED